MNSANNTNSTLNNNSNMETSEGTILIVAILPVVTIPPNSIPHRDKLEKFIGGNFKR